MDTSPLTNEQASSDNGEVEELVFHNKDVSNRKKMRARTKERIAATDGFTLKGVPRTIFFAPETDQDMENILSGLSDDHKQGKRKAPIPDFEQRLKPTAANVSPASNPKQRLTDNWKRRGFVSGKNSALAEKMRGVHAYLLREEAGLKKDFPSLHHKNYQFIRTYFPEVILSVETFPEVLENYSPEAIFKHLPHVNMKMAVFIHRLATHKGNDLPKIVTEINRKEKNYRFCVKQTEDSDNDSSL